METLSSASNQQPRGQDVVPMLHRTPISLGDAIRIYTDHLHAEGKASAREQRSMGNKMLGLGSFAAAGRFKFPADLQLHALTARHLLELRAARRAEGNGLQTIAHELKLLRAAALHAHHLGHEIANLRWRIPSPTMKTRWLTVAEWRRVYDELDPARAIPRRQSAKPGASPTPPMAPFSGRITERQQARDLFVALTLTGGRWSEIRTLTTDSVQPEGIYVWGSKTQRERMVACPPLMAEAMERRRRAAQAAGSFYLFPGRWTGAQKTSGAIRRAMERAQLNPPHIVERQGRATIHSLRHTFASWMLQGGMDLTEVQTLLGHGSLHMTRRYAHLAAAKTANKAARKLAALLDDDAD